MKEYLLIIVVLLLVLWGILKKINEGKEREKFKYYFGGYPEAISQDEIFVTIDRIRAGLMQLGYDEELFISEKLCDVIRLAKRFGFETERMFSKEVAIP